jgi:hypothetical protein
MLSKKLIYIYASLAFLALSVVFYATSYFYYSSESKSFFKNAKVVEEIKELNALYGGTSTPEDFMKLVQNSGLKDFVTYDKSSATMGEYTLEGLDPEIGWSFLKSVIQKGYGVEALEIEERDDHRLDIFLKVMF